jgi:hypothetical protein
MTVRVYKSTDASAPSLTGAVGSLVALLDAILVNGYGSMTAAGWTKPYSAANKGSYQMVTSGNTGFYLDVNDAAPVTAKEAEMRAYEIMTASATGTNPFPTVGQSSFGVVCRKSTTADGTARVWYCVASTSTIYLFVDTGDFTSPAYSMAFYFGDFFSYKSGDANNCAIIGRSTENNATSTPENLPWFSATTVSLSEAAPGHYVSRTWTGTGGSIPFAKHTSILAAAASTSAIAYITGSGSCLGVYPNGPDAALELAPIWVGHNLSIRGYLKGLWAVLHKQPTGHGDTFSGTGNMSGKSFLSLNIQSNQTGPSSAVPIVGNQPGQIVVETSDTWS